MKNQSILYGIIGLLAGSLLTVLYISSTVNSNNVGMMRMMGIRQGAGSSMSQNIDKHFIEQMIPHHQGAIDMANLTPERTKNSDILTLSKTIIESQSREIKQMQAWYRDWYGTDVPENPNSGMGMGRGMMHGGMMSDEVSDIESLANSKNFDKDFLQEMIPHHQMAVMMSQMLLSGSNRPEMKQLAQDIIAAQEKEIDQMRNWLGTWSL